MEPELTTLTATPWRDARASLSLALSAIGGLPRRRRLEVVASIADARPDTAAALWLAEEITVLGTDPADLAREVGEDTWADPIALTVTAAHRIGAVSLGWSTRRVLETVADIASEPPVVVAKDSVVARGLEDLGLEVIVSDPSAADATLVPTAAVTLGVIWTSQAGAAALEQAANPTVLTDPVTVLGSWAATRYRPPGWVSRIESPA